MSNIDKESMEVEQLDFSDESPYQGKYSDIIASMNYSDYLSAVYGYEERFRKKQMFDKKLRPFDAYCEEKRSVFSALLAAIESKDAEKEKLRNKAISNDSEDNRRTQGRMDVRISQEIERAKQQAAVDVSRRKAEYTKEVTAFNERASFARSELSRLNDELKDIRRQRLSFDEYTTRELEVADIDTLELLQTAKRKRWLTAYHRELLKKPVKEVCAKRISSFEELIDREESLAKSDMISDVRKGEVTDRVINEFAFSSGVAVSVVMLLLSLGGFLLPGALLLRVAQAVASCLLVGGAVVDVGKRLLHSYRDGEEFSTEGIMILINVFVLGCVGGFFAWRGLIPGKKNLFSLLYTVLSAASTGFLFREVIKNKLLKGYIKKLPLLKNRARCHVFEKSIKEENGKYNLGVYCYLNHEEVLGYLSMYDNEKTRTSLVSKEELNRNIYKKYKRSLVEMKEEAQELNDKKDKLRDYIDRRQKQLDEELLKIRSSREPANAKLPDAIKAELERINNDIELLKQQAEKAEKNMNEAEQIRERLYRRYCAVNERFELITEALRYWYNTPKPSATEFRLLDAICFESNKRLNIIHHNLQPFAFQYTVKHRDENPIRSLRNVIFRYIRGLIKINPCRMLQINIIDPVSDPDILLNDTLFKRISPLGVINGVHSLNDFEIRLFTSERTYNTFRSVFRSQCSDIQRLLSKHQDMIPAGEAYSVELANRIKNDEKEPFMYEIMMFVVPREDDETDFLPPAEIVKAMESGTYLNMGLIPIFFVDSESIHDDWKKVVNMCPQGCSVTQERKLKGE